MGDLALQVAEIDLIVIREQQAADAGGGEVHRHRATQATEADDQDRGGKQLFLAVDIDVGQHQVTTVAQQLLVVHSSSLMARPCGQR
jgi:hypothetical protein